MKFKKILLVSILLLAILTIGAASASDNTTDSGMLDAADDVILDSTDSSDVLADGSYYDDDFYIYVQENYTQGKRDWDSYELIYISSYSQKNSTIDILVDGVEKQCIDVTDGHFSVGFDENGTEYGIYYKNIYPTDLKLDYGSHNLKVNVNGNTRIDTPVSINEMEDFTIWLQNPFYCEEEYWNTPSFIVIDSNNLNNATLEIYVNGTRKLTYTVTNGLFEEIADCSNKSRYVAASDLFNGYGKYNVQIKLTENGATKTLKNENVTVAEFEPTVNPKLDLYFDFYTLNIPADDIAYIYLPREATGKLTISYNNVKNQEITYSKGYATHYIHAWDLNHLGENKITVTYKGDDFGILTTTETVIVVPTITSPAYVSVGEKFSISMMTHEWVNGDFNVYDYNSGKKGKLLASNVIRNRVSSVELTSNVEGLNRLYLEFAYPGGYYPIIQEIYVVKNSNNISVDIPSEVLKGSDFNVSITAPASDFTFVYITVDGADSEFFSMADGKVVKTISGISDGAHKISVQYNDGTYADGKLVGNVYSNTFDVNVGLRTEIIAPAISTKYNVAKDLTITLRHVNGEALADEYITVTLNGKTYKEKTNNYGQLKISVNLPAKTYTAKISFAGDDTYDKSSASAKVVVSKANPSLSVKAKTFKAKAKTKSVTATLKDNKGKVMKNTKVTLKVNKKTYTAKTNSKGVATFKVKLTKKGTYKATYKYAGSSNYNSVSKTANIKIK